MQLCFFEDEACRNFEPLTLTRPTDDLRTGILTMREKWLATLKSEKWGRCIRPGLGEVFPHNTLEKNEICIWVNSRYLPSQKLIKKVNEIDTGVAVESDEMIVMAKADSKKTARWFQAGSPDFSTFTITEADEFLCIRHLWDLFLMNGDEIVNDLERLKLKQTADVQISDKAVLENKDNIFMEEGIEIQAGVVLIANDGPIYLGRDAKISAGAIIEGPAAVCKESVIKPGAKIHSNTTVGPVCKAGGGVSDSVFHSYSNKGHDGYVGHSLIGQWCNLGAGTNTSNLKNNYSNVRITDWRSQKTVETGQQFLGTIMGDHTKTAIGTRLNTGTICGASCNIFSAGFPPKFIPSFSWVGQGEIQPYKLKKAFETMQAMMGRRNAELNKEYKRLMQTIFAEEHND